MRTLFPAALIALVAADLLTPLETGLVDAPAHAIIGAPLTPVSYAGVARRTTRRVAYGTAAVATTAAMAAPPPPTTVYVQQPAPQTVVVQQPAPQAPPPK